MGIPLCAGEDFDLHFGAMNHLEQHGREIERCNQRGVRTLSVFDLLDAGMLTRDLEVWLNVHR